MRDAPPAAEVGAFDPARPRRTRLRPWRARWRSRRGRCHAVPVSRSTASNDKLEPEILREDLGVLPDLIVVRPQAVDHRADLLDDAADFRRRVVALVDERELHRSARSVRARRRAPTHRPLPPARPFAAIAVDRRRHRRPFAMSLQDAARDQPFGREQIGALELADRCAVAVCAADLKRPILESRRASSEGAACRVRTRAGTAAARRSGLTGAAASSATAQESERVLNRHRASHSRPNSGSTPSHREAKSLRSSRSKDFARASASPAAWTTPPAFARPVYRACLAISRERRFCCTKYGDVVTTD